MGSKQGSLWQSRKMDHNLSYRGPIWVIQKPKINFTDANTIYKKETSQGSPFFLTEKKFQISTVCGVIFTSHVTTIE